jgi:hypothetical protein
MLHFLVASSSTIDKDNPSTFQTTTATRLASINSYSDGMVLF